jgi:hypothetical protein
MSMQGILSYTRRRKKRTRISGSVAIAAKLRFHLETLGALNAGTHVARNVFSQKCDLSEHYSAVRRLQISIRWGLFKNSWCDAFVAQTR